MCYNCRRALQRAKRQKRGIWESWLMALSYWHISIGAAMRAGTYRKTASEAGRTISVTDSLLAALAYENNATLLTSNIKDYPMKDVRVMSLRRKLGDAALLFPQVRTRKPLRASLTRSTNFPGVIP